MRRGKRELNKRRVVLLFIITFSVSVLIVINGIEKRIGPKIEALCRQSCRAELSRALSEGTLEALEKCRFSYEDITVRSGDFTGIKTEKISAFQSEIVDRVNSRLSDLDGKELSIPVGSIGSSYLFFGRGFDIDLHIMIGGSATVKLKSSFTGAGINQTCHTITAVCTVQAVVIMPGGETELSVSEEIPVAEGVINGRVPSAVLGSKLS